MKKFLIGCLLVILMFCAASNPVQYYYADTMREGYKYVRRYDVELIKVDTAISAAWRPYYIFYYKYKKDKE